MIPVDENHRFSIFSCNFALWTLHYDIQDDKQYDNEVA